MFSILSVLVPLHHGIGPPQLQEIGTPPPTPVPPSVSDFPFIYWQVMMYFLNTYSSNLIFFSKKSRTSLVMSVAT